MKIKEIFDKISNLEQHEFEINKLYEPKTKFEIKDQYDNWTPVVGMIVKKDDILEITTTNKSLKVGSKHVIQLENDDMRFCKKLKVGDILKNIHSQEEIIKINNLGTSEAYDLSIDTDQHLYSDSQGFIHHNTFTVKKMLKGTNHEFFTGAITSGSALYKVLFINNDPDKVIVFDDLDTLLDDRDCINMLKGALDTGEETEISYLSNNTVSPLFYETIKEYEKVEEIPENIKEQLLREKVDVDGISEKVWDVYRIRAASPTRANALMPNKFNFVGRVIFISNKYLYQIPGAIKSRAMTVEVSLTLDEIVSRIESVMKYIQVPNATDKHKKEALDFIKKKVVPSGRVRKLDFRTFMDVVKFAMSDAPNELWHRWAATTIMQKYASATAGQKHKR